MNKELYIKIIKDNPKITYEEIIKKYECKKCFYKGCKNHSCLNTCIATLKVVVPIWELVKLKIKKENG